MGIIQKSFKTMTLVGLLLAALLLTLKQPSARAVAPSVVINEIMYHPSGNNENNEFLELYNTTASPIDLNGWCFTKGISLCFTTSTILGSHSYGVVSPNAAQTLATYGITTIGTYTGNLDNGGEKITLTDNTATTENSLTYSDHGAWPTAPDGNGPSLELKDPTYDNTVAGSWGASIGGPTPEAVNTIFNQNPPIITDVTMPTNVQPGDTVTITANVQNASTIELDYKVNFDADQILTMYDDGNHGDGAASDGVYGATIPAQSAGQLVRYKVNTSNGDGPWSAPSTNDSINYYGYVVQDSSVTSPAPIFNWFLSDADYDDMNTNHRFDNQVFSGVLEYNGQVYDNTQVSVVGQISRNFPKPSYKFTLPKGTSISIVGGNGDAIDTFHMAGNDPEATAGVIPSTWWVTQQSGLPVPDILPARMQRNGQFQGLYIFEEKYPKQWLNTNGYTGALYESSQPSSNSRDTATPTLYQSWHNDMMLDNTDPNRLTNILDENNIPNMFNYWAVLSLTNSWDHDFTTNIFEHKDTKDTGRWSLLYWDMDSNYGAGYNQILASPYDYGDGRAADARFALTALYDQPVLKSMYMRRLRTLYDKFYANDQLLTHYRQITSQYAVDNALDIAKWPFAGPDPNATNPRRPQDQVESFMQDVKYNLGSYLVQPWGIPASQTDSEKHSVTISQAHTSLSTADEYIKLTNNANTPVDISGWTLSEINYTIPQGAVIPAHNDIYLLKDDLGYRTVHPGTLVAGQYSTSLGIAGLLTLQTDTGDTIDALNY